MADAEGSPFEREFIDRFNIEAEGAYVLIHTQKIGMHQRAVFEAMYHLLTMICSLQLPRHHDLHVYILDMSVVDVANQRCSS